MSALLAAPDPTRHVGAWLRRLAQRTKTTAANPLTEERLAEIKASLLREIPASAFTQRSLDAISVGMKWFPALDELRSAVAAHWNANCPADAPRIGPRVDIPPALQERFQAQANPAAALVRQRARQAAARAEWMDAEGIRRRVLEVQAEPMAGVLGGLLGSIVAQAAPEHIGLIPEEWRPRAR